MDATFTAKGSSRALTLNIFFVILFSWLGTMIFLFLLMLDDGHHIMPINGYGSVLLAPSFRQGNSVEIKKDDEGSHVMGFSRNSISQIASGKGSTPSLNDGANVKEYSNLQSNSYINHTIEQQAQNNEDPDKCSRVFLYLPDDW